MSERRDAELDQLLSPLRTEEPTEFEMGRWKKALHAEGLGANPEWIRRSREASKWIVAAGIGFALNSAVMRKEPEPRAQFLSAPRVSEVEVKELPGRPLPL